MALNIPTRAETNLELFPDRSVSVVVVFLQVSESIFKPVTVYLAMPQLVT